MSVGKGTEAIMVISRVRRHDTYAYKVLGTNAKMHLVTHLIPVTTHEVGIIMMSIL